MSDEPLDPDYYLKDPVLEHDTYGHRHEEAFRRHLLYELGSIREILGEVLVMLLEAKDEHPSE